MDSYYKGKDLFKGTAWYYARYRPAYPQAVFDCLIAEFHLEGKGTLLDLGCGPGDLAIPLSHYFTTVKALDIDDEMLAEGRAKAEEKGIRNIDWVKGRAEEIPAEWRPVRLVTIGKAFHWMDQKGVLDLACSGLEQGRGLALVGESGRIWQGKEVWQTAIRELLMIAK